jgi:hypothetical protein
VVPEQRRVCIILNATIKSNFSCNWINFFTTDSMIVHDGVFKKLQADDTWDTRWNNWVMNRLKENSFAMGFKPQFVRDGTAQSDNCMFWGRPYNFPRTVLLDNLLPLSCFKESLVYEIYVGKSINVSLWRKFTCSPFHPPPCKEDLKWWYSLVKQGRNVTRKKSFFRCHSLFTDSIRTYSWNGS